MVKNIVILVLSCILSFGVGLSSVKYCPYLNGKVDTKAVCPSDCCNSNKCALNKDCCQKKDKIVCECPYCACDDLLNPKECTCFEERCKENGCGCNKWKKK